MKNRTIFPLFHLLFPLMAVLIILTGCSKTGSNRVESLLAKMSLEEKIGQMMQLCFSTITADRSKRLVMDTLAMREAILEAHAGSFISGTGGAQEWVDFVHEAQRIAVEESRLGIPLLIGIDHIHGANYVNEGTILPHSLTLSCSFDAELVASAGRLTAIETADLGLNWNFAPVLDLGKNPYWPRLYETYGEDPLVCAVLGAAYIRNLEGCDSINPYRLAGCAKHFIGYSDPKTGWDRTPAEIPPQVLYEYFIPPFRAAVEAGVRSFMLNSGEVNGEPVHISKWLQQDVLRKQLGFEGVILSDIKDILRIVEMHAAAPDEREATFLVVDAGVDMSMSCNETAFTGIMKSLVEEGRISEARIDESVRRILQLKEDLGLFENPFPRTDRLHRIGCAEHRKTAQKMAEESIVLLKNDGLLPLAPGKTHLLLAGFAADSKKMLNGAWTLEWLGAEEGRHAASMHTLREALGEVYGPGCIHYLDSASMAGKSGKARFLAEAQGCDAILLTLGEKPYSEFKGNISDLDLPADQLKLADLALETGKPVIIILIEGRPRNIIGIKDKVDALIFAGLPGSGGADALAGVLSGAVNPSGRLSFTYPSAPAHVHPYYHKTADEYTAEYPFGHGLSYTTFGYGGLKINDSLPDPSQPVEISVIVENTGKLAGSEVVMLFACDRVGMITRPVRKLVAFKKISLEPGEHRKVVFEIDPWRDLSYPDKTGQMILEEGAFDFYCGDQKGSIYLKQGY